MNGPNNFNEDWITSQAQFQELQNYKKRNENEAIVFEITEEQKIKCKPIIEDLIQCLTLSKGIVGKYSFKEIDGIDVNCFQYIKKEALNGNVNAEFIFHEKERTIIINIV